MMETQSWLNAHRPSGPLRQAQRAGVAHALLQRAALCGLTANAPPRLLLQKLGRGRLIAAELRFPACAGAVATLTIEVDGAAHLERRCSLHQNTPVVSAIFGLNPAPSYRQSLRLWLAIEADVPPLWAAIEVALEPGQTYSADARARAVTPVYPRGESASC